VRYIGIVKCVLVLGTFATRLSSEGTCALTQTAASTHEAINQLAKQTFP